MLTSSSLPARNSKFEICHMVAALEGRVSSKLLINQIHLFIKFIVRNRKFWPEYENCFSVLAINFNLKLTLNGCPQGYQKIRNIWPLWADETGVLIGLLKCIGTCDWFYLRERHFLLFSICNGNGTGEKRKVFKIELFFRKSMVGHMLYDIEILPETIK